MISINSHFTEDSKPRQNVKLELENFPGLLSVALSHGSEIEIVQISREGMILETDTRLQPDFKIVLKVVTNEGPQRVNGVVLRSAICSLERGPRYRSAVEFQQPLELLGESVLPAPAAPRIDDTPARGNAGVDGVDGPAIMTVLQAATMTTA